jgi:hypothetical protein
MRNVFRRRLTVADKGGTDLCYWFYAARVLRDSQLS